MAPIISNIINKLALILAGSYCLLVIVYYLRSQWLLVLQIRFLTLSRKLSSWLLAQSNGGSLRKNNRGANQTLDAEWSSNVEDLDEDLGPADTARNDSLKKRLRLLSEKWNIVDSNPRTQQASPSRSFISHSDENFRPEFQTNLLDHKDGDVNLK